MNSLSWFLYLADVVQNVGQTFVITGVLGSIGFGLLYLFTAMYNDTEYHRSNFVPKKYPKVWYLMVFLGFLFAASLIPSKETIYLIAGSEAGEMVIQTPEAQQIMSDVHEVIRLQLQELKGEDK